MPSLHLPALEAPREAVQLCTSMAWDWTDTAQQTPQGYIYLLDVTALPLFLTPDTNIRSCGSIETQLAWMQKENSTEIAILALPNANSCGLAFISNQARCTGGAEQPTLAWRDLPLGCHSECWPLLADSLCCKHSHLRFRPPRHTFTECLLCAR